MAPQDRRTIAEVREQPLSPTMLKFLNEYMVDFSVTRAAERAGYAPQTARTKGSYVLNLPASQAWLKERLDERAAERAAMEQRIIDELEKIAFFNVDEYVNFDGTIDLTGAPPEMWAAVVEVKTNSRGTSYKFASKLDALEKLARHTGKFNPKIDLTSSDGTMSPPSKIVIRGVKADSE